MGDTKMPAPNDSPDVPDGNPEPGAPEPPPFNPHPELIGDMERGETQGPREQR